MKITQAPQPCNICGGREFVPAENGRLAASGLPPRCRECGSLEPHRILRAVFQGLPGPLIERARCLQLSPDRALDANWFSELVASPRSTTMPLALDESSASYGWVCADLPLVGNADQAALDEMLRLVGNGCLVLVDSSLSAAAGVGEPTTTSGEQPARQASSYADTLRKLLPETAILELVGLDACTLALGSAFIASLDGARVNRMAEAMARVNIHARVFAPTRAPRSTATRLSLPREFDESIYRSLHADLAKFSDQALRDHYQRHGQREGRRSHALTDRRAFASLLPPDLDVIEIGPFHDPMVAGPRVRYFDLYDKQTIIARASSIGYPTRRVPDIHYVSPDADLSIVTETFDAVVSSHVVENQPDFVGHLLAVRRLLRPGGLYLVLIPDKNYCFDHFMPSSTIADFLDAHFAARTRHTLRSSIANAALRTHNDPERHWRGDHGVSTPSARAVADARAAYVTSDGSYRDCHAWYFEPSSFKRSVELLHELGTTDFEVSRLYPTLTNHNEFWAVLRAGRAAT